LTELAAKSGLKQVIIEATIIRADGTRQELGVISDSKWSKFLSPSRFFANKRIAKANEGAV
jgi:hypothetical protein